MNRFIAVLIYYKLRTEFGNNNRQFSNMELNYNIVNNITNSIEKQSHFLNMKYKSLKSKRNELN